MPNEGSMTLGVNSRMFVLVVLLSILTQAAGISTDWPAASTVDLLLGGLAADQKRMKGSASRGAVTGEGKARGLTPRRRASRAAWRAHPGQTRRSPW